MATGTMTGEAFSWTGKGRIVPILLALSVAVAATPARSADEALCRFLRQKVVWALVVEPRGIEVASGGEEEADGNGLPDLARGAKTPWIEYYRAAGCPPQVLAEDLLRAERIVVQFLSAKPER